MSRFFIPSENISENRIIINGSDVNHIKNVLRYKKGNKIEVSDSSGNVYSCEIEVIGDTVIELSVLEKKTSESELSVKITLFQGMPKGDKMDMIVQKTVELGVAEIVPVNMERTIVKLDKKKAEARTERWNKISESAAKQSGRGIIPKVYIPVSFKEALKMCSGMDMTILPYENADGMSKSAELIKKAAEQKKVAVFIGPEGGFSSEEVEEAEAQGAKIVTLGRRILRTETAGLTVLSLLMFENEVINDKN